MLETAGVYDFYETENECNVAAVHRTYVAKDRLIHALLPVAFIYGTSYGQICDKRLDVCSDIIGTKTGHLSGHSSPEIGGFMEHKNNCCHNGRAWKTYRLVCRQCGLAVFLMELLENWQREWMQQFTV